MNFAILRVPIAGPIVNSIYIERPRTSEMW
jgi:hypothetical protein